MDTESTAVALSGKGPDARAVRRGSPSGLDERKDECAPARPIPSAWGRRKTSPLRDAGSIRDSPASSDRPDGRPRPAQARRRHRRHPGTESRGNRREPLSSQWAPSCHPAGSTVHLGRIPRQCREASRLHTGHAPPTSMSGSERAAQRDWLRRNRSLTEDQGNAQTGDHGSGLPPEPGLRLSKAMFQSPEMRPILPWASRAMPRAKSISLLPAGSRSSSLNRWTGCRNQAARFRRNRALKYRQADTPKQIPPESGLPDQ